MRWVRASAGWARAQAIKKKPMVLTGTPAPAFTLPDLDGRPVGLADLHRTHPALLVFFKVSCPVCQMTLPFLDRLQSSGKLRVMSISQDNPVATQRFRAKLGIALPALLDDEDAGYPVSNAFQITNVPSLFLVEPDGVISLAVAGFSKTDLEAIAERAGVPIFQAGESVPEWRPG